VIVPLLYSSRCSSSEVALATTELILALAVGDFPLPALLDVAMQLHLPLTMQQSPAVGHLHPQAISVVTMMGSVEESVIQLKTLQSFANHIPAKHLIAKKMKV
jgi:hypothetical protein